MNITIKLNKKSLLPICAENAPQKEKILRPECDADTQSFLSAVYKKRYTSEKIASRFKQSGRSMIEMLGVLAIIGVLTVGSITGYSRAMRRHLLNKQREQISYILSAIETHYDIIMSTSSSNASLAKVLQTFGWIPEEMFKDNSPFYIYDVFNNKILMTVNINERGRYIAFSTTLNHNAYEQCINIYYTIQSYSSSVEQIYIKRYLNDVWQNNSGAYYGDRECTGSRKCIRDLTPAQMSQLCHLCDTYDSCQLVILWPKK